ncbi:MAG: hypothetical protein AMXMBFR74_12150 [Parvibaculum sp.]
MRKNAMRLRDVSCGLAPVFDPQRTAHPVAARRDNKKGGGGRIQYSVDCALQRIGYIGEAVTYYAEFEDGAQADDARGGGGQRRGKGARASQQQSCGTATRE